MRAEWIVERTESPRFPFRIRIEQDGRVLVVVRAREAWPGAGTSVFCLRERALGPDEVLVPHERVPVVHLARIGRKLSITLDRPHRKRCELLKVLKPAPDGGEPHEQMFLRTETAARAHRTKGRVEVQPTAELDLVVDMRERYPWAFPGARTTRRGLPVGDYALVLGERVAAVVERKSLENFCTDVAELKGLHQQLAELGAYAHAAFVIEAQYGDLADPKRIGKWPGGHLLRVVAELAALHPRVPVVFAGNRKLANVWAHRFFAAVAGASRASLPDAAAEALARYAPRAADGGVETQVRVAVLQALPAGFAFADLRAACPGVADARLRQVLGRLRAEGRVRVLGTGRRARWERADRARVPAGDAGAGADRPEG